MSNEQPVGAAPSRTLADELRARDDDGLAALLRTRPDLLSPVPNDLTQLATRAGTRASVVRAVERLDRFALQTAEALAVAPDPCSYEVLRALLTGDPDGIGPDGIGAGPTADAVSERLPLALAALRAEALLWGGDDRLRLVRTARELLAPTPSGPSPTGLGPTLSEATAGMSPGRLQEILATVGLPPTHDPVSALAALTGLFTDRKRMAALLDQAPPGAVPQAAAPGGASEGEGGDGDVGEGGGTPGSGSGVSGNGVSGNGSGVSSGGEAPSGDGSVLGRLMWGPPYGTVDSARAFRADPTVSREPGPSRSQAPGPAPAITWLLARGLLLRAGERTVVLPREVALHLRAGRAHRDTEPVPPAVGPHRTHAERTVDATAGGQAFTALTTLEELLSGWEADPPSVLRAGGLGVRDLKRTAVALDLPEPVAAFWIELAYAAGLLAPDGEPDERYAPTPAYDDWLRDPPGTRWARLITAWLPATRVAGLAGGRDAKGRTLAVLGPGIDRGLTPDVRQRTLALLAALPPGAAPDPAAVLSRLRWERPLRGAAPAEEPAPTTGGARAGARGPGTGSRAGAGGAAGAGAGGGTSGTAVGGTSGSGWDTSPAASADGSAGLPSDLRSRLARWALTEAELLGLTGRGALASHARPLCAPEPADSAKPASGPAPWGRMFTRAELSAAADRAAAALTPLLPEPLDHVLLQADLTAVAPGPLERPLGAALGVLADVESKGGATVYRFTPGSVRRALDAGRTAADIHAFLAAHSRTPVPQPLSYLIDDIARKHGRLRVGTASCYVRCDDDALLAEVLADRRSESLRLRLLAPTVLASPAPPDQLLARLREMGYAPAAESGEGDVLLTRPDAYRTPPRSAPDPVPDGPPVPDPALLSAAVRAIRAGDHAATAAHRPGTTRTTRATDRVPGGRLPRTTAADTLATMQSAALTGAALWIGYVNADGAASQRVIAPVRVEGGFVTAYDHTADEVRTYPLHRITGVAELADEAVGDQ